MRSLAVVIVVLAACTKSNPEFCKSDADCKNVSRPFCDVKGEYEESDYTSNTCSVTPQDCPIERCGCSPGTGLSCDGDMLTVCGEDGHSTERVTCELGCFAAETRCYVFTPSNDLQGALDAAADEGDVLLPQQAHVDTTLGTVQDANGNPIQVRSIMLPQNGGASMIRAFFAKSFIIDNTTITGDAAAAFVAREAIVVRGLVDASANANVPGPGAQESPAVCVGTSTEEACLTQCTWPGGGGGGNAKPGGSGGNGALPIAGGALVPGFVPLVGGCRGGSLSGTMPQQGGAGGGAVQLVALRSVTLTGTGFIDVGGGAGMKSAGGGSGGLVIVESPVVSIDGATTGITANGGSGGGCDMNGTDGGRTTAAAIGPACAPYSPGSGGTGSTDPQGSPICTSNCFIGQHYGGGGGSAGRLRVVTRDGSYALGNSPIVSAAITTGTLDPK